MALSTRPLIQIWFLTLLATGSAVFTSCASSIDQLKDDSIALSTSSSARGPSDHRAYLAFLRALDLDRIGEAEAARGWLEKAIDYDPYASALYVKYGQVLADLRQIPKAIQVTRKAITLSPNDYDTALQLADLLQVNNELTAAEAAYRAAIDIAPDQEEAYIDLAFLYRAQGRPDEGLLLLDQLNTISGPLPARARLVNAALHKDMDQRAEAEADYLAVLNEYPNLVQAHRALLDLYFADADMKHAAERLEALHQERPWFSWIPGTLVGIYARLEDVEKINRHLRAEEESDPENAEQLRLEAVEELANRREFDKALTVLAPLLESGTENEWALFYAGFLYARKANHEQALAMYGRIPEDSKLYSRALEQRARSLYELNRVKEAVALIDVYLEKEPDAEDIRFTLVGIYNQAHEYTEAMAVIDEILARNPDAREAVVQKAFVLQETSRTDEAIDLMRKAIRDQNNHLRYHEALALIYAEEDRHQEAIDVLLEALKVNPDSESIRFSLGTYYDKLKKHDEAIAQMQEILERDENNTEAMNFIGYTWAELGIRLKDSELLIKRAIELDPDNGYITDSLGWVYFKAGRYEEAVRLLERAVQLTTQEPIIVEHLGDAYLQIDEKQKALESYARAAKEIQAEERPDPVDLERIVKKYNDLKEKLQNGAPHEEGVRQ